MAKKLFIQTLGCAMNVRDSEHIIAELQQKESYELCDDISDADLCIINTCSVREKPVSKLFSEIGVLKKKKKPNAKIGICGCTASHLGKDIIKQAPVVDFVLGARHVSQITQAIQQKGFVEVDTNYDDSTYEFSQYRSNPLKSYINISIGCDKQCTFCIVPHTRGEEISIPSQIILKEAQKAVEGGAKEVFLLGQNVNNYGRRFTHHEKIDTFVSLLDALSQIDDLERIRFTSPHPLHMDNHFLDYFASNNKLCKSIHMPLQSGSSEILKSMKRGYSKEWFLDRVAYLKELCPECTIGTDIIVGFPGESEKDFEDTLDIVQQVRFEQMYSFCYSPRPHTKAALMQKSIPEETASKRLYRLQELHTNILDEISRAQYNTTMRVYFDELRPNGLISGRSDTNFLVLTRGSEELLGTIKDVQITEVSRTSFKGEIL